MSGDALRSSRAPGYYDDQRTGYDEDFYGTAGPGLTALFQYAPPTSVSWDTGGSSSTLFVAWGGSSNQSAYEDYYPGTSTSTAGPTTATRGCTRRPPSTRERRGAGSSSVTPAAHPTRTGTTQPVNYYDIGLTVSDGVAYIAYQTQNYSYAAAPGSTDLCGFPSFGASNDAVQEWLMNSTDGTHWSTPLPVVTHSDPGYSDAYFNPYLAYNSAILIQNGLPIVSTSMPSFCSVYYTYTHGYGNYTECIQYDPSEYYLTDYSTLNVATVDTNPTIAMTINMIGLPGGSSWSVAVSGNVFTQTTSSVVVNVPNQTAVIVTPTSPIYVTGTEYVRLRGRRGLQLVGQFQCDHRVRGGRAVHAHPEPGLRRAAGDLPRRQQPHVGLRVLL